MNADELYQLLDDTANMLRGMRLDPSIPRHAKEAIGTQIQILDKVLENWIFNENF